MFSVRVLLQPGVGRDSALIFVVNAAGGLLTVGSLALLSRVMSAETFGSLALGLVLSGIVRPVTDLGLHTALVQRVGFHAARNDWAAAHALMQVATAARLLLSVLLLLLLWPLGHWLAASVYHSPSLAAPAAWGIAIGVALGLRQHAEALLRAEQRFSGIARANLVRFVGLPVMLILLIARFGAVRLAWAFAANLAAPLLFVVVALPLIPWRRIWTVRPAYGLVLRSLAGIAVWIGIVRILDGIAVQLDVPLVRLYLRPEQVAYYFAAYKVLDLFTTLAAAVSFVLLPYIARLRGEGDAVLRRLPGVILTWSSLLALPAAVLLWVVAPVLLPRLWGSQYRESTIVMRLLLPGAVCALLTVGTGEILMANGLASRVLPLAATGFVSNVTLLTILLPRFGIEGAALATSTSYALVLLLSWTMVHAGLGTWPDLSGLVRPLGSTVVMVSAIVALMSLGGSSLPNRLLALLFGFASYVAVLRLFPWRSRSVIPAELKA